MTKLQAKRYVARLQKKFPNPRVAREFNVGSTYCVGGAFCIDKRKRHNPFPSDADLAIALNIRNNSDYPLALMWARRIIDNNDARRFEKAWHCLEQALIDLKV